MSSSATPCCCSVAMAPCSSRSVTISLKRATAMAKRLPSAECGPSESSTVLTMLRTVAATSPRASSAADDRGLALALALEDRRLHVGVRLVEVHQALRLADHQEAARSGHREGVAHHALLARRVEVDHHVAQEHE